MNKYFELQYWLEIIGLIIVGVFVLIFLIKGVIETIIDEKRRKKWEEVIENEKTNKKNN